MAARNAKRSISTILREIEGCEQSSLIIQNEFEADAFEVIAAGFKLQLTFRSLNKASVVHHWGIGEVIVERRLVYFDLFTVKMKTNRTRNAATCSSLGAHHLSLGGSSCSLTWNRFKILSPLFWNKQFWFVDKFCLTRGSRVSRVVGNSFPLNMPWRGRVCIAKYLLFKEFGQNQSLRPGMQNGCRG